MSNPWLNFPTSPPYQLLDDQAELERFNAKLTPDSPYRFNTSQVIAEPFIGAVTTAAVIVLQLNPGFDPENDPQAHADHSFSEALHSNLRHAASSYPFYFFDPQFDKHPGSVWWGKKTRELKNHVDPEQLAKQLAVIEWFPYKSSKYKPGCIVASQNYSFNLVKAAIERNALIIISRGISLWEQSVPELRNYERKLTLSSVQNVALSRNNLKWKGAKTDQAWAMLLGALNSSAQD